MDRCHICAESFVFNMLVNNEEVIVVRSVKYNAVLKEHLKCIPNGLVSRASGEGEIGSHTQLCLRPRRKHL
jgi:hypothetical protein